MSDNELDFLEYLDMLKDHWAAALVSFLIVFGLVIAYTMTATPMYEASSLVYVSSQDQSTFLVGNSFPRSTSNLETQKVMLESMNVLSPVYVDYPMDTFSLKINAIKNSNILEIVVESNSSVEAMKIANKVAQSYVAYNRNERSLDAKEVSAFITDQISAYEFELNEMTKADIEYQNRTKDENVTITIEEQIAYENLLREMNAKKKIYDYLLNKREEAGMIMNLQSSNVEILSYATLPEFPVKPNVPLNLALGLILAAGAGIGVAYLFAQGGSSGKKKNGKVW